MTEDSPDLGRSTEIGTGSGAADVPASSGADIRTDHAQDRAAESSNPRTIERNQDAYEAPAKPSGKTTRQLLQEEFAKARQDIEARGETYGLGQKTEAAKPTGKALGEVVKDAVDQAKLERDQTPAEAAKGRDAKGRFQKKDDAAAAAAGVGAPEPGAANVQPQPQPAPPALHLEGKAPPPGWSAEAKATWAALPPHVQQAIGKREQEMDAGGKGWAAEKKAYDEAFPAALENSMKQYGITRAGYVKRASDWHMGLSDQNKDHATGVWLQAAGEYKIPLPEIFYNAAGQVQILRPGTLRQLATALAKGQPAQLPNQQPQPDPRTQQELVQLRQEVAQLRQGQTQLTQTQQAEQDRVGEALYNEFTSKNYEHANNDQVRAVMADFVRKGLAPTKQGRIDVDGLYNKAAQWLDLIPNAAAQAAQQEQSRQAQAKTDAAAHRQAHAAQARNAGVSLSNRAPTAMPAPAKRTPNAPPPSVRDRLLEAIEEQRR
jgi:hypothetical protein